MRTSFLAPFALCALAVACGSSDSSDSSDPSDIPGLGGVVPPGTLPDAPPAGPTTQFTDLTATAVGAIGSKACAILPDHTVLCWGDYHGVARDAALGKNAFLLDGSPAGATQLSSSDEQWCARYEDGHVRCWRIATLGPTQPADVGVTDAQSVSVGENHACAVAQGKIWCWGDNHNGQLGDGTKTDHAAPSLVPGIDDAQSVAAGDEFTCALLASKRVKCWGANSDSQIGIAPTGTLGDDVLAPTEVTGLADATALAAGTNMACVIRAGQVVCWGNRYAPQIPQPERIAPPLVAIAGIEGATTLALRVGHSTAGTYGCASTAGKTYCWDPTHSDEQPLIAREVAAATTSLSVEESQFCGVLTDQHVICTGSGARIGGAFLAYPSPVYVPGIDEAESLGDGCVIRKDKSVRCWGNYHQSDSLGTAFDMPALHGAERLVTGFPYHVCGSIDGLLHCEPWPGSTGTPFVLEGLRDVVQISGGRDHTCARLADETVSCWAGTSIGAPQAAASDLGLTGVKGVLVPSSGAFSETVCVVQDTLRCTKDELTVRPLSLQDESDVQLTGASVVAGSADYFCALGAGGVACGAVGTFILGTPVPDTAGASLLTAGGSVGCAVFGERVRCWGSGSDGALGPGNFGTTVAPVDIVGVTAPTALRGGSRVCALAADGRVQCWGSNAGAGILPAYSYRTTPEHVLLQW